MKAHHAALRRLIRKYSDKELGETRRLARQLRFEYESNARMYEKMANEWGLTELWIREERKRRKK